MKELSIEEKAQRYDEAIKRVNAIIKVAVNKDEAIGFANTIFPEFKESEDEQTKKWILEYLYDGLRKSDEQFEDQFKAAIAWLEKQGKIAVTINIDKLVRDYANNKERGNEEFGKPINCMIRAYRQGLTDALLTLNLEKQGEQKENLCDQCRKLQPFYSCQDITSLGRCAFGNL